jgi:hypothetical protein
LGEAIDFLKRDLLVIIKISIPNYSLQKEESWHAMLFFRVSTIFSRPGTFQENIYFPSASLSSASSLSGSDTAMSTRHLAAN